MSIKTHTLTSGAALILATMAAQAQVTLTDIGAANPTPGVNDITQFSTNGNAVPPGLNYYWDDGHSTPTTGAPSQSFTTLNNPAGYILTSLAIKTGGIGSYGGNTGATPFESQPFALYVFELSNPTGATPVTTGLTNATLIASFTATGQLIADGDWMQWTGLGVPLSPGTNYAYAFGISTPPGNIDDWETLATTTNLPYSGGQVCLVPNAGGKVKYSSTVSDYDAVFDIGISFPSAPIANTPLASPSPNAILAGTNVTLTASAGGSGPITYTWQTDGGTGGTLTNIPGATGLNFVVNTAGWLPGTYEYDFVASNSLGTSVSPTIAITIVPVLMADIGPNAPTPGPVDISQLLNTSQSDDGFNYYTDNGANHDEWNGQTFTTGTNQSGYLMTSIAWKSAGNGNSFPTIQLYDLYIYSLSANGTTATQIATYQAYGGGTENDWFEWVGIKVPLAPNTLYAYTFGRDATSTGWEHIGDQGSNPYAGGQICQIPSAGGPVTYGTTGDSDATFDIGLAVSEAPFANLPSYAPNVSPIYAGTTVTLTESAVGAQPLYYSWLTDGGSGGTQTNIPGATASNLVVNTTTFVPGTYNYESVVTNAAGTSTSAALSLNIVSASEPVLVTDITPSPLNQGFVGGTATFTTSFTGTLPIAYQWTVNTGSGAKPISAASNPSAISNTLVLTNLQLTNAGTYTLVTSNSVGGPVLSSSSTLTVFADPGPPASGSYAASILAEDPVAYWRFDETNDPSSGVLPAYDSSGHNFDGLYGIYSENGCPVGIYFPGEPVAGPRPPAFPGFESTNTAMAAVAATTNSWVMAPPLNLDTNTVTITMWIYPNSPELASSGLFMNRNSTDAAGLGFGTVTNTLGMAELGYTWNTNSSATWGFNTGLYPLEGQWSFVALVVEPTQATVYLYYIDPNSGKPDLYSAANPIAHGPEKFNGGTTWIGDDEASLTRIFNGSIDEVAVFNSALTSDQVLALFSKGAGLTVTPPSIGGEPESRGVYAGTTAVFTASGINGTSPFTYQWQFNGTNLANGGNISGATTPILTISNVTVADVGSYQLFVTNPVTNTPSTVVTLIVVTPVPGSYESAVLANDPLLYWKLDETNDPSAGGVIAYDYVSGIDGVYQIGAQNGFDGIQGPRPPAYSGFLSNNWAMETLSNTANSYMTAAYGTAVASNLTYAMWIKPYTNVQTYAGLLMDRGGAGEGLGFGGTVSSGGMAEIGYTWNQNSSDTYAFDSLLFPPINEWSFVAMVIEPTQGTLYLINSNGIQTAVNLIPHDTEEFGVAWHLGDDATGTGGARTFPGTVDEVSVYLSALSSNQIISMYDAGVQIAPPVALDIAPAGVGSLTLTWSQGTLLQATNLAGPWSTNTASSPFHVSPTNSHMFFKVLVN